MQEPEDPLAWAGSHACVVAISPGDGQPGEHRQMRVDLDLFSGRPNPAWELTAAEAQELLERLSTLPEAAKSALHEGLGYRGITVTALATGRAEVTSVVVSGGTVTTRARASGERWFRDTDRALERWLLETGRRYLEPDVYSLLNRELTQGR